MIVRKQLNALRTRHGARSPIGSRCSNLIEQLKNYPLTSGEARIRMEQSLADSVEALGKMTAGGGT